MAAFCGCCGAEITGKPEACPVCGTPRHGMFNGDREITLHFEGDPFQPVIDESAAHPSAPDSPPSGRVCGRRPGASVGDDQ